MGNEQSPNSTYVLKVREDTRKYVEKLLDQINTLHTQLASVEGEKTTLEQEVTSIRQQMERRETDQDVLEQKVAAIEAEKLRFSEEYQRIERQNTNLANLYVTSYRLHSTLERGEVLSVILEILINLVGSEEVAIFEINEQQKMLELATSFGIDTDEHDGLPLGSGVIGGVAETGKTFIGDGSEDASVTACVPMKVDGKVTGVITVFSLLPQKSELESMDMELFELLSTHAAVALYCSGLHASQSAAIRAS